MIIEKCPMDVKLGNNDLKLVKEACFFKNVFFHFGAKSGSVYYGV